MQVNNLNVLIEAIASVKTGASEFSDFSRFRDQIALLLQPANSGQILFGAAHEQLRESQIEALTALQKSVKAGDVISHIVGPGGMGKTRIGIAAGTAMHRTEGKSLFIVPSQQAVRDFSKEAKRLCPRMNIGSVYEAEKSIGDLTFATYASALRGVIGSAAEEEADALEAKMEELVPSKGIEIDPQDYNLVIWDEAHWYLGGSAKLLLDEFRHAYNLGLTATPRYYDGKEVRHQFGKCIYELDLATARERQEVAPYKNLIVNTRIKTGLRYLSRDQEESDIVAKAINVAERNEMIANVYETLSVEIDGNDHRIFGEPTIVFGANINHVHFIANAMNRLLMPKIKSDPKIRELLMAKGINPDAIEAVAAPIHSGAKDNYPAMDIHNRNEVIRAYEQRKYLALVATSVLQQSFDSPQTSVVMDTVERMTFVGVGQNAMRALRYQPGKTAVVVNFEDRDHETLTLLDCELFRGEEEGIELDFDDFNASAGPKKAVSEIAGFEVKSGVSLAEELTRRNAVRQMQEKHERQAKIGKVLKMRIKRAMRKVMEDDPEGVPLFTELTTEWRREVIRRLAQEKDAMDEGLQFAAEADAEVMLLQLIMKIESGDITSWSQFATEYRRKAGSIVKKLRTQISDEITYESLDEMIEPEDNLYEDVDPLEEFDRQQQAVHETLPYTLDAEMRAIELQTAPVLAMLYGLSITTRQCVEEYYGLDTVTASSIKEIAHNKGVTQTRIRQIICKGLALMGDKEEASRFRQVQLDKIRSARTEKAKNWLAKVVTEFQSKVREVVSSINSREVRHQNELKVHELLKWNAESNHFEKIHQLDLENIIRKILTDLWRSDAYEKIQELLIDFCEMRKLYKERMANIEKRYLNEVIHIIRDRNTKNDLICTYDDIGREEPLAQDQNSIPQA